MPIKVGGHYVCVKHRFVLYVKLKRKILVGAGLMGPCARVSPDIDFIDGHIFLAYSTSIGYH